MRFYDVFPRGTAIDKKTAQIVDWRVEGRGVTDVGSGDGVERSIFSTSPKSELSTSIRLAGEELRLFALRAVGVPIKIASIVSAFDELLRSELLGALQDELDRHAVAQLQAAAPQAGHSGANLIETSRAAIAALVNAGFSPDTVVVGSDDALANDLTVDGAGAYVFAPSSSGQLWKVPIVTTAQSITPEPIVLDSTKAAALYLGSLDLLLDPFGSGHETNTFALRAEFEALLHVRSATAAYVVTSS